jgi:hypothetical protein
MEIVDDGNVNKHFAPLLLLQSVMNITKVDDAFSFKCLKPWNHEIRLKPGVNEDSVSSSCFLQQL